MDFRVLGTLEVTGADGPRHVHGRKELCVLAAALRRGRGRWLRDVV